MGLGWKAITFGASLAIGQWFKTEEPALIAAGAAGADALIGGAASAESGVVARLAWESAKKVCLDPRAQTAVAVAGFAAVGWRERDRLLSSVHPFVNFIERPTPTEHVTTAQEDPTGAGIPSTPRADEPPVSPAIYSPSSADAIDRSRPMITKIPNNVDPRDQYLTNHRVERSMQLSDGGYVEFTAGSESRNHVKIEITNLVTQERGPVWQAASLSEAMARIVDIYEPLSDDMISISVEAHVLAPLVPEITILIIQLHGEMIESEAQGHTLSAHNPAVRMVFEEIEHKVAGVFNLLRLRYGDLIVNRGDRPEQAKLIWRRWKLG